MLKRETTKCTYSSLHFFTPTSPPTCRIHCLRLSLRLEGRRLDVSFTTKYGQSCLSLDLTTSWPAYQRASTEPPQRAMSSSWTRIYTCTGKEFSFKIVFKVSCGDILCIPLLDILVAEPVPPSGKRCSFTNTNAWFA